MAKQSICSIPNCGKTIKSKGFCNSHYLRSRRHGNPLGGSEERCAPNAPARFIQEVAAKFEGKDCLIWPFSLDVSGYGQAKINGSPVKSHRYVCELVHGSPPTPKHQAAHACGNRECVNPNHLSWKTPAENEADKLIHGTHVRGERHVGSKLTETDVKKIRSLLGIMKQRDIAAQFGISQSLVNFISTKRNWAWLPD